MDLRAVIARLVDESGLRLQRYLELLNPPIPGFAKHKRVVDPNNIDKRGQARNFVVLTK
jgi:hypothetical protein